MAKWGKKANKQQVNLPSGWFYMADKELFVADLQDAFADDSFETDIWRDLGILEICVGEKNYIDVEHCEVDLEDEYSNDYLEAHHVKSLFYLSFKPDAYEACLPALKKILAKHGGFICGDTDDFTPVIR